MAENTPYTEEELIESIAAIEEFVDAPSSSPDDFNQFIHFEDGAWVLSDDVPQPVDNEDAILASILASISDATPEATVPDAPAEQATDEESEEESDEEIEETYENLEEKYSEDANTCSICYEELNIDNIVNTMCNHLYCKTCFFKWLNQGYNCPMCRRNFLSLEKWYEGNDVNQEIDNETILSQKLQLDSIVLSKRCRELQKKNKELSFWNKQNMKRQISLREQIDYSKGYIIGLNKDYSKHSTQIHCESISNSPWFQGFTKGVWNYSCLKQNKKRSKFKRDSSSESSSDSSPESSSDSSPESSPSFKLSKKCS
jgi:hypothetical protein